MVYGYSLILGSEGILDVVIADSEPVGVDFGGSGDAEVCSLSSPFSVSAAADCIDDGDCRCGRGGDDDVEEDGVSVDRFALAGIVGFGSLTRAAAGIDDPERIDDRRGRIARRSRLFGGIVAVCCRVGWKGLSPDGNCGLRTVAELADRRPQVSDEGKSFLDRHE